MSDPGAPESPVGGAPHAGGTVRCRRSCLEALESADAACVDDRHLTAERNGRMPGRPARVPPSSEIRAAAEVTRVSSQSPDARASWAGVCTFRRRGCQRVSSRDGQRAQRGDRWSAGRPHRGLGPSPMAGIAAGSRSMDPTGCRTDGTATAALALARRSRRGSASRRGPHAVDSEALIDPSARSVPAGARVTVVGRKVSSGGALLTSAMASPRSVQARCGCARAGYAFVGGRLIARTRCRAGPGRRARIRCHARAALHYRLRRRAISCGHDQFPRAPPCACPASVTCSPSR